MFLALIELLVFFLFILFGITQIIQPFYKGLPVFPMFRQTEKIKETIISKQGELHNEELLDQVDQLDTQIIGKKERRSKK